MSERHSYTRKLSGGSNDIYIGRIHIYPSNITGIETLTCDTLNTINISSPSNTNVFNGGIQLGGDIIMNGNNISDIGTLSTNTIVSNTISGTLSTSSQPNITGLGTLNGLVVNSPGININTITTSIKISNGTYSTAISCANPTANRVITLPDKSITVNSASDIMGNTLSSSVLYSSLTSLGVLSSLSVSGDVQYSGVTRCWVNYDDYYSRITGYNVNSVTRLANGVYTINFTYPFSDTNYAWVGSAGYRDNSINQALVVTALPGSGTWKATSSITIITVPLNNQSYSNNPTDISLLAFCIQPSS